MNRSLVKAICACCASLFFLLSGCGANTYTASPVLLSGIETTTNFGDSITCGIGASASVNGYASLLDAAIGKPATNLCRSGDQAADMTRLWVYPNATPILGSHQLYTIMIGTNDADFCGASSGCVANWSNALEAALTWLALPAADKQVATAAGTRMGTWIPDLTSGLATTGSGASLTFTVNQAISGHQLFVAYRVFDSSLSNPGLAALTVDGSQVATLSSAITTGQALVTHNGTPDTIFVTSVPLGAVGSHIVGVTATGFGGAVFSLQWVGASSGNYEGNPAAPRVVVGSIIISESSILNATIAPYNLELTKLVASLITDGMQITIAPTDKALDPATDFFDSLHPDDAGHRKLEAAFVGVLSP